MLVRMIGTLVVLVWCLHAAAAEENPTSIDVVTNQEPFLVSYEDVENVPVEFQRQVVPYVTQDPPGTVVVDTDNRYLYLVLPEWRAIRYGIGVGREGFEWNGNAEIARKTPWPMWFPPKAMVARDKFARKWRNGMPGGPKNPLGARALYLYANGADTLYRIHGTNQPTSIGQAVSSGCVRMLNIDVIDLSDRVNEGTKVVVMGTPRKVATKVPQKRKLRKVVRQEPYVSPRWYSHWRLTKDRSGKNVALKPKVVQKRNFNLNRTKPASE